MKETLKTSSVDNHAETYRKMEVHVGFHWLLDHESKRDIWLVAVFPALEVSFSSFCSFIREICKTKKRKHINQNLLDPNKWLILG